MSKTASFYLKWKVTKISKTKFEKIDKYEKTKNSKKSKNSKNNYLVRYHYCLKFPLLPPDAQQLNLSRLRPRELKHFLSMQKAILKILIQMWFEPLKEANRNQMNLIG